TMVKKNSIQNTQTIDACDIERFLRVDYLQYPLHLLHWLHNAYLYA
ncbi:MAG: hypothetical protein RL660_2151, partial [Bacteroidota bacterium]